MAYDHGFETGLITAPLRWLGQKARGPRPAATQFDLPEGAALPHPLELATALLFHPTPKITARGAYAGLLLQVLADHPTLAPAEIVLIDPVLPVLPDVSDLRGAARITLVLTRRAPATAAEALAKALRCRIIDRRRAPAGLGQCGAGIARLAAGAALAWRRLAAGRGWGSLPSGAAPH